MTEEILHKAEELSKRIKVLKARLKEVEQLQRVVSSYTDRDDEGSLTMKVVLTSAYPSESNMVNSSFMKYENAATPVIPLTMLNMWKSELEHSLRVAERLFEQL